MSYFISSEALNDKKKKNFKNIKMFKNLFQKIKNLSKILMPFKLPSSLKEINFSVETTFCKKTFNKNSSIRDKKIFS